MRQMTYAYLGSKNIFTDDVGLYLRGNWKSRRKLVPTFYQWWCVLRDLLGNHNIQVLISSPECRQCVSPTLKKNNGENIIVFITPKRDWEWAMVWQNYNVQICATFGGLLQVWDYSGHCCRLKASLHVQETSAHLLDTLFFWEDLPHQAWHRGGFSK